MANGRCNLCLLGIAALVVVGFSGPVRAGSLAPAALAGQIDQHIAARWNAEKVTPTLAADDATFARRVHLDLAGRIPSAAEVRTFLDDKTPEKRAKLVSRLVDSAAHARHAANFWRRQWVPQADAG